MRAVMDDLVRFLFDFSRCLTSPEPFHQQGLSKDVVGASSMFTGEEEVFAFARACSRLVQMGSREWAETAGLK